MTLPNLIHPVDVTIEQIDTGETAYDEDSREPIQQAGRKDPVTIKGQPKWRSESELETTRGGPTGSASGYVLFRVVDLTAVGITLRINDRIIMQGHLVDEVYISRLQPAGHYADQNGASLLKAWFVDRLPSKQRAT